MKKILFTTLSSALFLSCTNSKPTYTKMIETSYNFNQNASNPIMSSDTLKGEYSEVNKEGNIFIFENNSDFMINVSEGNTLLEVVESKTKGSKFIIQNGFEITNKKAGDTLIIQYLPTKDTPASVLKFGIEFKLYN